jgi:hypothetical protein
MVFAKRVESRLSSRPFVRATPIIFLIVMLIGCVPTTARAQVDTGNISGTIADESGGVLPGVTVTATNLATGIARTTVTDPVGRYQVTGLQPASYSVKADLQGFTAVVRSQVTVNIGTTIDVNFTLRVATLAETVNVTSDAPLVESTKTEISTVIDQKQLDALPSLNRQYLDFALLLPASIDSQSIVFQGAGFSIGGARSSESALLVDGFYNMDEGFDLPKQRYSQDSIQEFQVISFGGEAQYGRAVGGILNGITKSGGNVLRGTAYDFYQNQNLNSEDPASVLRGIAKPPYGRQQFGGTLGGPIKTDKTFFFGAYERVKQDYQYDNTVTPGTGAALGLSPSDIGNVPRYYRLNFALAKADHNLDDRNRLQASFAMSRWTEFNITTPVAFGTVSRQYDLQATDWSYLLKWTNVGDHSVQELKASFFPRFYGVTGLNQGGAPLVSNGQINPPGVSESNASPPSVNISSVASFGSVTLNNNIDTYPVEAIYASTRFIGAHTVKFGADYMYAKYDYTLYSALHGTYTFSSLVNFQKGLYSQFTEGFGDPNNFRQHQYLSGFAQDSWRVNNRLTFNYGLRYDLEVHPLAPNGQRLGWDRKDFGPRFAASFALDDKATTLLKFASGIYYDRIFQNISTFYTNIAGYQTLTTGTWTPTTSGSPVYPNVFISKPSIPAGVANTNILPTNFATPASSQVTGTIEHSFTPTLAVTMSAIYTHGWNVDWQDDANLQWTGTAWIRPNAGYRQILQYQFNGWANYVGGIFELKNRGTRMGWDGSLTLNHARDVGNNYNSIPNDQRVGIAGEYGPGADTPTARGVLSGWFDIAPSVQVSAKFQARTGMWVNPVDAGVDLIGAGILGSRTPGFGRNSFSGPGFNQTDLRATWMMPIPKQRLSLYLEAYNVFNRINVQTVNNDYGATPGQPLSFWMQPTAYYPPRQIQIGAHWSF